MKRNEASQGEPTRPDLLARIAALGITDKAFCDAAGLAPSFLSKARAGGCVGPKAAASWSKIEAALAGSEVALAKAMKTPGQKLAELVAGSETAVPAAPGSAPSPARARARVDVVELVKAIHEAEAAGTVDALRAVNSRVMSGTADGSIDANTGRTLAPLISRAQQLLELGLKHAERAQAGEPLVVEVRYVYAENWRAMVDARPFMPALASPSREAPA